MAAKSIILKDDHCEVGLPCRGVIMRLLDDLMIAREKMNDLKRRFLCQIFKYSIGLLSKRHAEVVLNEHARMEYELWGAYRRKHTAMATDM